MGISSNGLIPAKGRGDKPRYRWMCSIGRWVMLVEDAKRALFHRHPLVL